MVRAQSQVKWAKLAQKSSTYEITHKNPYPKQKIFF